MILRALRSDSREWRRRMGVGEVWVVDGEVENGLVGGGERRRRTWAWTSACVVVTGASAAAVIPDHLGRTNKSWEIVNGSIYGGNVPSEIIDDGFGRLYELIVDDLVRMKVDHAHSR
jgi:hypothetical protein